MFKYVRLIIVCAVLVCGNGAGAQILNSDRILQNDSTGAKKFIYSLGISGSIDKQNRNLLNVSASNDLSVKVNHSKQMLILLGKGDLVLNGSDLIQNSGYVHLRFRDNDRLTIAPEYFTQFQWNGVLGMNSRYLLGANLRWLAIQKDVTKLSAGFGFFGELEDWSYGRIANSPETPSDSIVSVRRFRLNQYVKLTTVLGQISDIVFQEFVQSNPMDPEQTRFSLQASLQIRAGKHLAFMVGYEGLYDTRPIVPISKYLFGLNSELRIFF